MGVGADLAPGTVLAAYRQGLFPMPVARDGPLGWWSPDPRAVIPLDGLHVSRSLRKSARKYERRVDTAFADVVEGCAEPNRPHGWITPGIQEAYQDLHQLGWAHSVETWAEPGLVGGVYGVAVGGLFAGESMFHRARDASKVALLALVEILTAAGDADRRLFDVQWLTPHLESLGAIEISRAEYLDRLGSALTLPDVDFTAARSG